MKNMLSVPIVHSGILMYILVRSMLGIGLLDHGKIKVNAQQKNICFFIALQRSIKIVFLIHQRLF